VIGGESGAWQVEQYCAVSSFIAPHFVQYLLMLFLSPTWLRAPDSESEPAHEFKRRAIVVCSPRSAQLRSLLEATAASGETHAHTHDYYEQDVTNDSE
jgi:hypothetical protein